MTIDKLDATTPDLTQQNIARLTELFPECVTEGPDGTASDRDGPVIDFDLLRQALADHLVEGPQERYRLDWPGKRQALLTANAPIDKTLRPMRKDSVDFDSALKEALRTDETQRIDSAAAYFRDVADRVTFSQVADYDQLMQLITNG